MATLKARVERLEDRRRNPYDNDPRFMAIVARLNGGTSIREVSNDDLSILSAWADHEKAGTALDVRAMSDEELERAVDGDETVLARYRRKAR